MKYIIDEEELKVITNKPCLAFANCKNNDDCTECDVKDLLKFKQPVEEIVDTNITLAIADFSNWRNGFVEGNPYIDMDFKIFIQKETL